MKASNNCVIVVKHYESCRLVAYPDPKTGGDPWTIGWGATGYGIKAGEVWTQEQADQRLVWDIGLVESEANNALLVKLAQGQFDAFVSALFNIGPGSKKKDGLIRLRTGFPSTFLKRLNEGDYAEAREQLGRWVSPGSAVEHGLRRRRTTEQGLWDGMDAASAIVVGDAL